VIIIIQTNITGRLSVWLTDQRGRVVTRLQRRIKWHGSERLLVMVDRLMRRRWFKLKKIIVVRGPGPFTAVRTGLVVANTVAWLRSVPLVGYVCERELQSQDFTGLIKLKAYSPATIIYPWYGKEPNITKAKTK